MRETYASPQGCIDLHELEDDMSPYHKGEWRISRMVVQSKYRGQGIGSFLMTKMILDADEQGVGLVLEAIPYESSRAVARLRLREFYARFGFENIPGHVGMMRRKPSTPRPTP